MAIITNNLECKSPQPQGQVVAPLSVGEVRERLTLKAVAIVGEIVRDSAQRTEGYGKNIKLLNAGVFYGNWYFKVLKATNQKARFDFFMKKGSFYHGYASPKHFNMTPNSNLPTGVVATRFVLKEGIKPSEALEAMRQGPSFIGCGEVCQIAYYEAIKDLLGTEKFDALFSAHSSTPLTIQIDSFNALGNPINRLVTTIRAPEKVVRGQIVFIQNTPYYRVKHMNGDVVGFVAICCDDTSGHERFTTLGLRPEGMTRSEVSQVLLKEFNEPPIGMAIVTEEVATRILRTLRPDQIAISKQYEGAQFSIEELIEQGGGQFLSALEFNVARVTELANRSLPEARALFDQWKK
jgi:hypothetical protein